MRRLLGALVVSGTLGGGCSDDPVRPDEAPAEWTACTIDNECSFIEIGCCDHCNGGELFGVRKDHRAEALRKMKKDCDGGWPFGDSGGCGLLACSDPEPICQEKKCEVRF